MRTLLGLLVMALPLVCAADVVVPIESVESYVNIRLSPQAGTDIVGRLQKGVPLPLVASIPGWYEVEISEGETGFVSSDWAAVIVEEAEEVVAEPAAEIAPEDPAAPEPAAEIAPEEPAAPEPAADVAPEEAPLPDPEPVVAAPDEPEVVPEPAVTASEVPVAPPVAAVQGEPGPPGPPGPSGPAGAATIKGKTGFLVKFKEQTIGTDSQVYDNGNQVGIGTTEPKQRLEVNGNIQIHARNSGVAGLMITQSSGETGYIMHNRASTLTIGAGSVDRITIDRDGNVGVGVSRPAHPLELASGAHASAGGVWTNSSSRAQKDNITNLSAEDALAALAALQPVQFNYRDDAQESYVGFIAEDVPELVATGDRTGLSPMDIVAVLTKVVQLQQQQIEELKARLAQ